MKNKEDFLTVLESTYPNIQAACDKYGIVRKTYQEWRREFPEFKERVDAMRESLLDITENVLFNAIKAGDTKAAMFALKYLAKNRGYTDSLDVNVGGEIIITTTFGGKRIDGNKN